MRKMLGLIVALALALSVAAWAGELEGKIQKLEPAERMIVFEDGTQIWLAEGVPMDTLKEGATVKATYEERDGKKVATAVEVRQ